MKIGGIDLDPALRSFDLRTYESCFTVHWDDLRAASLQFSVVLSRGALSFEFNTVL